MSIFGNIISLIFGSKFSPSAEEILTKMAAEQSEKYEWRTSIVDLMKLLKMDSGLEARKNWHRNWDIPALWMDQNK